MTPGILGLQGGFEAHGRSLKRLGFTPYYVRTPKELAHCDALILPGGESTVMVKLLRKNHMFLPLQKRIKEGLPVFGTCAGMILLSSGIDSMEQETLGAMDFRVERNSYGRQISSFEAKLHWNKGIKRVPFIRAPKISQLGKDVIPLLEYQGIPVLIRQGYCLAASFHPELTEDPWLHEYFLKELVGSRDFLLS